MTVGTGLAGTATALFAYSPEARSHEKRIQKRAHLSTASKVKVRRHRSGIFRLLARGARL